MDPIGQVVVLEDTNNDGKMDKRTVFADGLVLARVAEGARSRRARGGAAERLADARHRTATCSMDTKELVTDEYGRREARVEQNANDLHLGPRQLDAHGRRRRLSCGSRTASSRCRRRCRAASGA